MKKKTIGPKVGGRGTWKHVFLAGLFLLAVICVLGAVWLPVEPHLETHGSITRCVGPRVRNMRDLGGWRTADGRRVRKGLVYRSAAFNTSFPRWHRANWTLGETSRDYLAHTLGIRTDLDLRRTNEVCGITASPLGADVHWVNIPAAQYEGLATVEGRAAFAQAFRLFLEPANYPIVFHCKAGRDRTGTLAFVLNALLGVARDDLAYDWQYTWLGRCATPKGLEKFARLEAVFASCPGETLQARVAAWVRTLGFTDAEIAAFQAFMLEPVAGVAAG